MHRAIAIGLVVVFAVVVTITERPRGQAAPVTTNSSVTGTQVLQALDDASGELAQLARIQQKMMQISKQQAKIYSAMSSKATALAKVAGSKSSQAQLAQATQNMLEAQTSFNLQYLGLQNQIQSENSQFTLVSNVMKTKHDTVKNSISNIR